MKSPFNLGDRLRPECEPRLLSVGDQFFTSNLGFTWEIAKISRSSDNFKGFVSLPSTPYLNNVLEDCRLDKVAISLVKSDISFPPTWWVSWSPSETTASAFCTIVSESGSTNVSIQTTFGGSKQGSLNYDYIIEDNYTTHASFWWRTRLLNAYWVGFEAMMALAETDRDDSFYNRGTFEYHWNETNEKRSVKRSVNILTSLTDSSIHDLDFFSFSFFLLDSASAISNEGYTTSAKLINMYKNLSVRANPINTLTYPSYRLCQTVRQELIRSA